MGGQCRPILRVLCTVLVTNGDTEDERHLQQASGHGLPLCHLVEDLIAASAEEVAVHEFDNCTATGHCIANACTDD